MSVRFPNLSPSLTSPIAMPATWDLIGTPASMSASDAPHTVAIEEDPLDSRMSDTTRIVYGKSASAGSTASTARRSEEHTSELQSLTNLVCRLLTEKKKWIDAISGRAATGTATKVCRAA